MTETAPASANGSEYDAQFTGFTPAQLRAALAAANATYTARCDHWDACHAAVQAAPADREARAAMRHAHQLATEQGKMVSALNRVLREKTGL